MGLCPLKWQNICFVSFWFHNCFLPLNAYHFTIRLGVLAQFQFVPVEDETRPLLLLSRRE